MKKNILEKISLFYLDLVSIEYVLLGILCVFVAIPNPIFILIGAVSIPLFIMFGTMVFPLPLFAQLNFPILLWLGDAPQSEPDRISLLILSIIILAFGVTAFRSTSQMRQGKKEGFRTWVFLLLLPFVIAFWNFVSAVIHSNRYGETQVDSFVILSVVWAVTYGIAFLIAYYSWRRRTSVEQTP